MIDHQSKYISITTDEYNSLKNDIPWVKIKYTDIEEESQYKAFKYEQSLFCPYSYDILEKIIDTAEEIMDTKISGVL